VAAEVVKLEGSRTWKTASFMLKDARLLNSQNAGADLRLALNAPEFLVRKVTLSKR
jgi:hypothetical protein